MDIDLKKKTAVTLKRLVSMSEYNLTQIQIKVLI